MTTPSPPDSDTTVSQASGLLTTALLVLAAWSAALAGEAPLVETGRTVLPAIPLRAFGTLAGEAVTWNDAAGRRASLLTITATDPAKAQLVQGKYLGDIHRTAGVEDAAPLVGRRPCPVLRVPGQGVIAVRRQGARVWIVSAADEAVLAEVLRKVPATAEAGGASVVPAWLDGWDAHGFRFYYRPWDTPGGAPWSGYPVLKEFDFARDSGNRGFINWAEASGVDGAVGLTNDVWWSWAARASERRGLTQVINLGLSESTAVSNAHREQMQAGMPQYVGGFMRSANPQFMGQRKASWSATTAERDVLGTLQQTMRRWVADPGVLAWLEPHGEIRHGTFDIFTEWGPVADRSYRQYLQERYRDVGAVARRWGRTLARWDDVRVPEVADFAGWGPDAIDCAGTWRLGYEPGADDGERPLPVRADPSWFAENDVDAAWPTVVAPGDDRGAFIEKKPAVLRRQVDVPAGWLPAGGRAWLYVWSLNEAPQGTPVVVAVNGSEVSRSGTRHATGHWCVAEVTSVLRAGPNLLALRLPRAFIGYRVYLTKEAPLRYPDFGEAGNARWVDFCDWRQWSRAEGVRRGLEALRAVDPDRPIICMSPYEFEAPIKRLCEDYGAHFHDTGAMAGTWMQILPMLMRSSGLPVSAEPGGAPDDLPGFKRMMGMYFSEGINAIHYYIHIGAVLWRDDIRRHYEAIRPLIDTMGTVHQPDTRVALLMGEQARGYSGYPWDPNPQASLEVNRWSWRVDELLVGRHDVDGLTEPDLERGRQARYRVIIDTNDVVMTPRTVERLADWVRGGGIFVALGQTGRHTPERRDAWPFAALGGWTVTGITDYRADGSPAALVPVRREPGETVLTDQLVKDGFEREAYHGLRLAAAAPECVPLARWADGSGVAIGLRPFGAGSVITVGATFPGHGSGCNGMTGRLLERILAWAAIAPLPAHLAGDAGPVMLRRFRANNGLTDQWVLWNQDGRRAVDTALVFDRAPAAATDVGSGRALAIEPGTGGAGTITGLHLEPFDTVMITVPRGDLAAAATDWFALQRGWWAGTTRPRPETVTAPPDTRATVADLSAGWRVMPLPDDGSGDPAALAAAAVDDSTWRQRDLGLWAVGEELPGPDAIFRRTFTVPSTWSGTAELWVQAWFSDTVQGGSARWWLDGVEIAVADQGRAGLAGRPGLAAGSTHQLAIAILGNGQVTGVRGNAWLQPTPVPLARLDLGGAWSAEADAIAPGVTCTLPGTSPPVKFLTRTIAVPADWPAAGSWVRIDSPEIEGVIINGRYVRRHHHRIGPITLLDISPWLRPGADNRLSLVSGGPWPARVGSVELWRLAPPAPAKP